MRQANRKKKRDSDRDYQRLVEQETLIFGATEEICRVLDEQGITRQELAKRLGKSKGFVTQVLSGERNMTLRTLADLAFALNHRFALRARPRTAESHTRLAHWPRPDLSPWTPLMTIFEAKTSEATAGSGEFQRAAYLHLLKSWSRMESSHGWFQPPRVEEAANSEGETARGATEEAETGRLHEKALVA